MPEPFIFYVIYPDNSVQKFNSLTQCATILKISRSSITKYLWLGVPFKGMRFVSELPPSSSSTADI